MACNRWTADQQETGIGASGECYLFFGTGRTKCNSFIFDQVETGIGSGKGYRT